jgi:hypothetical protein
MPTIHGLLANYDDASLGTAILKSGERGRIVDLFEDFVADATYRQMSRQAHLLGFTAEFQMVRRKINQAARTLFAKPSSRLLT